jgi:hypothetical protein
MNDELEGMCKETVVAYFNVLSRYSPEGIEENHENLRTVFVLAEIRNGYLPNTSQRKYRLNRQSRVYTVICLT